MEKGMSYNQKLLEAMKCSKIFKEHSTDINSIDFFSDGQSLVSASDDGMVNCYDIMEGKKIGTYFNKKYDGISNIRYTHSKKCVICSSNSDSDNRIMYWSLYDNTILVSFLGHTDQIIGLEMSNCDDNFISSSKDGSVRLWTLSHRRLIQHISKAKYGCLDPMGKNIAVLSSAENQPKISTISLYPVGVSKAIATSNVEGAEIKVIKYSPTGKHIVCVSDNTLIIVETLNWKVVQKMEAIPNESGNVLDPSFTPDGKFIACGSDTGKITIWEIETGNCVISLDKHFKFVNCVQFNYKHILLASACQNLLLWSPDEKLLSTKVPDKA